MMRTIIKGGTLVSEGRSFRGDLVIDGECISSIGEHISTRGNDDAVIDATGCFVLPGVIDEHVHFREPGLEHKADIESESRAAAYGGVTTYFDMPNTKPQTTTLEALADKQERAQRESHVNYAFFFGATNDNAGLFARLDSHRVPGIKLFMGASTGNMLVDDDAALGNVFRMASNLGLPLMAHCEDTRLINENMSSARARYGDDPDVTLHPIIRSAEACFRSSSKAVALARRWNTELHIAHVSTARELQLLDRNEHPQVTGEAVLAHLLFADTDYSRLGARIKCNPAVKTIADRDALRRALADGTIHCVGTDHAPHELQAKQGGAARAASGMPMVQFSLPAMLGLVDEGVLTIERLVELMCHNPARLFSVDGRGFLRPGYKADIAIVRPHAPWMVTPAVVQSKCGWSPLDGVRLQWRVEQTLCNGHLVFDRGRFFAESRGQAVSFRRGEAEA